MPPNVTAPHSSNVPPFPSSGGGGRMGVGSDTGACFSHDRTLEASLLELIDDHNHASLSLREGAEKAKKDAVDKALLVSDLLMDAVNGSVQLSFANEKQIESEIQMLRAPISQFLKQTGRWLAATRAMNDVIKEIGDFENWIKIMDFDMKSINLAIQKIHQPPTLM